MDAPHPHVARILESIRDAFIAVDRDWRFVYLTERAVALLGRPREALLGQVIWDVFPATIGSTFHTESLRAAREQRPAHFEDYAAGLGLWIENDVYPGPEGVSIYFRDITPRKRVETLREVEHAVARIVVEAPTIERGAGDVLRVICASLDWAIGGIWKVDAAAGVLTCVHMHGPDEAALGEFIAVSHGLLFERGRGLPGRVWATGKPVWIRDVTAADNFPRAAVAERAGLHASFAFPVTLGGETTHVVEFFSPEIRQPDEALLQTMESIGSQVGQFIERKRGEAERAGLLVREQAARAEAETAQRGSAFLAEASAVLAASLDYTVTLKTIARLTVPALADWCTVDTIGDDGELRLVALAHSDPRRQAEARDVLRRQRGAASDRHPVMRVLRTGRPEFLADIPDTLLVAIARGPEELAFLRSLGLRSGMTLPLLARERTLGAITLVTAESGRRYDAGDMRLADDLARRAALAIDNARLYRELTEADRRKDQFLAMLAHELRNPLAPMQSAAQVIRARDDADPVVRRAREVIERQVRHLAHLLDDLLDVARITEAKIELRRSRIDLGALVGDAVSEQRALADARGHRVAVTLPAAPVHVDADPTRLTQIVANLLNNAAKYTPPGGRIAVVAARDGADAVIRVTDDGIGIPAETLPHIFDLFSQGPHPLARSEGGLGLGLTVVRRLVELHGGRVTARSDGPGKGSVFVVRLPAAAEAPARAEPRAGRPPAGGLHVLVVEDLDDARDMLRLALELDGHRVTVAAEGAAALDAVRTGVPDVALVDIGLPGMDGYELARRLRAAAGGRIRLVALTGYGQPGDRERARQAGFDAHLVKPVDPEALARALHPD